MAEGIVLAAVVIVGLGLVWVRRVPSERDRMNQVIWLWVAMPVVGLALGVAHYFFPGLY